MYKPQIISTRVVLPAPDAPTIAVVVFLVIFMFMFSKIFLLLLGLEETLAVGMLAKTDLLLEDRVVSP